MSFNDAQHISRSLVGIDMPQVSVVLFRSKLSSHF